MNLTERQIEFSARLTTLLSEYTEVVGPQFDGTDAGSPAEMPMPTRWLLIAEWADVADGDNGPFIILTNSGINWVDQLGLIHGARTMVETAE